MITDIFLIKIVVGFITGFLHATIDRWYIKYLKTSPNVSPAESALPYIIIELSLFPLELMTRIYILDYLIENNKYADGGRDVSSLSSWVAFIPVCLYGMINDEPLKR